MLLGHRLPIFNKRAKRQTIAHPKFYFFDVGIYQILRPRGIVDTQDEIDGAAFETLFLQSLRAVNDYYELDYQFSYWRTLAGLEVDFIAYGANGFHAFEIKHSRAVSKHDTKGLKGFKEDFPEATCYLIYGGERRQYIGDVTAIPMLEALKSLPELLSS